MTDFRVETVVIGAGVVGLAIAYELSRKNNDVLILETEDEFGKITSSRNSGVIHAGIYYPENSLKAKFCVLGNRLLYDYCKKNFVPYINTKKLLIASSFDQINVIDQIKNQAENNGVEGIRQISKNEVSNLEPLISCEEALLVPSSGIVDAISLMRSLVGYIQDSGSMIAYNSTIKKINFDGNKFFLSVANGSETTIECKKLINSAGLFASNVANTIEELKKEFIPRTYYAKGNYFSVSRNLGIQHLIYPIPEGFGLGIHLTLELDHTIKFGPDVQWIDDPLDYSVDESRKNNFIVEIKKYLPSVDSDLLKPSYAGIRPILYKKDKSMRDFLIQDQSIHSIPKLINLYGIESPGLTSSLAIAKYVRQLLE
jgi:L-2-hydroxyglutarate oxidase LhgO